MKKIALLMIVTFLCVVAGGCGDVPTGRLQGNVAYSFWTGAGALNGNADHAKVTMTAPELPTRYDYSDQTGNYLIEHNEPGTYTVVADYGYATNMPEMNTGCYYYGEAKVNESSKFLTADGTYPDVTLTVENVTIADDVTTTVNFMLWGY